MSIDCKCFLDSATKLLENTDDEVSRRNAISRSYYSVYHKILPLVSPIENKKTRLSKQADLVEYLCDKDQTKDEKIDSEILRALGIILENAKKRRVDSDYKLSKTISSHLSELSIREAQMFYKILEDY